MLSLSVCGLYAGELSPDSIFSIVLKQYNQNQFQYNINIEKFDSSQSKLLSRGLFKIRYDLNRFHINYDNQLEQIIVNKTYYEINHLSSKIVVVKNARMDSSLSKMNAVMNLFNTTNAKLAIVSEDKDKLILKATYTNYPSYGIKYRLDKKSWQIQEIDFHKIEFEKGNRVCFLYHMTFQHFSDKSKVEINQIAIDKIVSNSEYKSGTKLKEYKIEYKN